MRLATKSLFVAVAWPRMSSVRVVVFRRAVNACAAADAHDVDVGAVEGVGSASAVLGDVGAEGVVGGVQGAVDGEDGAAVAGADGRR